MEIERRLAACGLRLLDNPYATHIALGLAGAAEEPVLARNGQWLSSNLGLARDCVALLVVLWALLIFLWSFLQNIFSKFDVLARIQSFTFQNRNILSATAPAQFLLQAESCFIVGHPRRVPVDYSQALPQSHTGNDSPCLTIRLCDQHRKLFDGELPVNNFLR